MKEISITISGVTPLLMHAFTPVQGLESTAGERSAIAGNKDELPRDIAALVLYWSQDKKRIIVPGMNLYRSIIDAGTFHKIGKSKVTTLKTSLVPAGMWLREMELPIEPEEWEVDARPVVIPSTGGRVLRYRPRFDEWSLSFTLEVDTSMFSLGLARKLVDDAGKKIGLGDFRPARKGPFGRFVVTSWTGEK